MFRLVASVASTRLLASVAQALVLLVLTRTLEAIEFGQFAAISAACGLVAIVAGLGLNTLSLRVSAFDEPKRIAATIALLRLPVVGLSVGITTLGSLAILGEESLPLIAASVLYAASESLGEAVESLLYGSSHAVRAQGTMLGRRLLVLAGVSVGFVVGDPVLWLSVVAAIVIVSVGLPLRGTLGRPAAVLEVLQVSIPLWGATVLAKLQTLDVVVASFALPGASAGVYSAAARVTSPLNILAVSVLSILTPRLASREEAASRSGLFRRSRRAMFFVMILLSLVSPLVGWATEIVLGDSYSGAFVVATTLTLATAVAAMSQVYVSHFYASGNGPIVARCRIVIVPMALIGGFFGALFFGPVALAISMLLSQLALWFSLSKIFRSTPL
ncbi:lipopolysaccharide biosynthesis protein [Microbacterium sp.]|uniref:lipopolysaccharide biosynthesis protein n=1 Tax=Microbacterium sp. TaxID=51671 RepID=UPI0027330044|nr:hypothetical protein [Microbacterium sp.]MDP3949103.1 hypothetical protein [Microbacterium sp.]